jgi:DNA damage-inducible protein 1
LTTSFSILAEQPMDMLLGLDILKRHQCIIDLERNMLVIKSANIETRFLPEAELPINARLNHEQEPEIVMEPSNNSASTAGSC